MPNTTSYTIFAADVALEGTKAKKATAVDLARKTRDEQGVAVRVETQTGNVVFELAAPKKIKMSKPHTRLVEVPEGVEIPEGFVVRYSRPRVGLALVEEVAKRGESDQYAVLNLKTSKLSKVRFATTRAVGAHLELKAREARERKAELAAKEAATKVEQDAPADV